MYHWTSEHPKFTARHKRVLRNVQIDHNGPGAILRDFAMFLAFFHERKSRVTGMHQLPLKLLPDLNARMARPITLGLQRPQQKSYPHLEGLYLLLRASGLTYIDSRKKTPVLVVDDSVLQSWESLNPTERYFMLLETWLLRGHPQIVGQDRYRMFWVPQTFEEWSRLFEKLPDSGATLYDNPGLESSLYFLELRGIALLELFGLLEVEYLSPVPGKGWQIGMLHRTPLGDALRGLLYTEFFEDLDNILALENAKAVPHGVLQPVLQPHFPAWQQTLHLPEQGFRDGMYVFRVDLWKGLWRRIAILANAVLDELADIIVDAYDFDHDHLYMFSYQTCMGREVRIYHPMFEEETTWTSVVRIGDLPLRIGQTMTYLFDFGDQWEFSVTLERIEQPDALTTKHAIVLESHGEPPEQYPLWEA